MFKALFLGLSFWLGTLLASAHAEESESMRAPHYLLETVWEKAEQLEPQKRDRLVNLFLETVAQVDDPGLLEQWEARLGADYAPAEPYEDYALEKVRRFINAEGWDAFFTHIETRTHPFNFGRPEMMAAAAEHIADDETAKRIYALMETFGNQDRSEAGFERASFGHALVEAAMRRCDLAGFDRALQMTDAPESIRYAFWRTRMEGQPEDLTERIDREFDADNSTLLRQALDGYGDVLRRGSCEQNTGEPVL